MPENVFPIKITATEILGIDRQAIPHRIGIPFPRGVLNNGSKLQLVDQKTNLPIKFQQKTLAFWPDNSVRWLLIDFKLDLNKGAETSYLLLPHNSKPFAKQEIKIGEHDDYLHIDNSAISFKLNQRYFLELSDIKVGSNKHPILKTDCYLIDDKQEKHQAHIEKVELTDDTGFLRTDICIDGHFSSKSGSEAFRFNSTITVFADSPIIELTFTLHNPNAARHKGGFWDMGDPGSLYFRSLVIQFTFDKIEKTVIKNLETGLSQNIEDDFRIYQDSSGGENWNHHIHIDSVGNKTVAFKGYRFTVNDTQVASGDRISPLITIHNSSGPSTSAFINRFWQNFPKAFSSNGNTLSIDLFPETKNSPYELQGGEKKTHTLKISFDSFKSPLEPVVAPLNVRLPLHHYHLSNALPNSIAPPNKGYLLDIIGEGIKGKNNFFKKRENSDEYGWRHFGDLWADHETLEHGNDSSVVSHYNNQYDAILGFLMQYIATGDLKWAELLEDLVQHVIDIDIYHTSKDRPQYNHGLFWHTDHYLDGRYCTHRSFSKHHLEISHVAQSGGGPGSEHCYSTGLLYYYFITGDDQVRKSLLDLAEWAEYANLGSNTVLERIMEFAKNDLKKIKDIVEGKYLFDFRFPLSRGTGNLINTLLDKFLLTNDSRVIDKVGWIIRNTLSANDEISKRELMEDIEGHWHYTVLLQSLIRYLSIKESIEDFCEDYHYALQAFAAYSEFVLNNEKPYLESSEILVYPNITWVAQDIRKAYILNAYALYCSPDKAQTVCAKRDYFLRYIEQTLEPEKPEATHTRILIIVLQNYMQLATGAVSHRHQLASSKKYPVNTSTSTRLSFMKLIRNVFSDLFNRLLVLNIKREIEWLKFRVLG